MANKKKWSALWISFFAMVCMFVPYVGYSVISIELMREFSINYTQVSLIASVTAIFAGLVLPFAGHYVDRYGPKRIMLIGIGLLAIGQMAFSLAPNFSALLLSRAVVGVGVGLMIIAPYTMAVLWFKDDDASGLGLGIMMGPDSAGIFLSNYLLVLLTGIVGWRTGLFWSSVALIALAFFVALTIENPRNVNGSSSLRSLKFHDFQSTLANRNVAGSAIYLIGLFSTFSVAVYWIPTILIEEAGWSAELGGFISSSYALAGFLGAFLFGVVSDKFRTRKIFLTIGNLGGVAIFAIAAHTYDAGNYVLLAALLMMSGLLGYGGAAIAYTLAAESAGDQREGLANGIVAGAGIVFGTVVVPTTLAYFKDLSGSYFFGFLGLSLFLLVVTVSCFLTVIGPESKKAGAPCWTVMGDDR